ncbi:MAG: electron transport complex subunit E, partial [Nevskiales bacterium]
MATYTEIARDGLWKNNPGFVQLLGLCPLLAVSNSFINALGLGLATIFVLVTSNLIIATIRNSVQPQVRIPVFVMVIAATVTAIELIMQAHLYELYKVLGIFIPLITTNCIIMGRAEAFAAKNSVVKSLADGLAQGLGFALALLLLGSMREILGQGTLLRDAQLLFGEAASNLTITVLPNYEGFLLAVLPPGAFLGLGLLIALKNDIDRRLLARSQARADISTADLQQAN